MRNLLHRKIRGTTFVVFSAVGGLVFGAALAAASTTISTNISTGALTLTTPLAVTSGGTATTTSFFGGLLYSDSAAYRQASTTALLQWDPTLQLFTTKNASTTGNASVGGPLWVGGNATTTAAGAISTQSSLTVGTLASTSQLIVGSDQVTTVSGIIQGTCSFSITSGFTASTTQYANCTAQTGTGLYSGYKVFVQATSSMPSPWIIQAASSTNAAGTTGIINLRILNTGLDGSANAGVAPAIFINFWAVR